MEKSIMLHIYYRISDGSYKKNRLLNATKQHCLQNLLSAPEVQSWPSTTIKLRILMDNCKETTQESIIKWLPEQRDAAWWAIQKINGGSSAQSFNAMLDVIKSANLPQTDYLLLVEDDYLWSDNWYRLLNEGLERADYVSGYDHLDKYINGTDGGNPLVEDGGEVTRVIKTKSRHWKLTNSTTLTFATKVKVLLEDEPIWRKHTTGTYPRDFDAFMELRNKGRTLITPIPGFSTHTEVDWLSPFIDWSKK